MPTPFNAVLATTSFLAILFTASYPSRAEDALGSNWAAIANAKTPVTIRGIPYVVESAGNASGRLRPARSTLRASKYAREIHGTKTAPPAKTRSVPSSTVTSVATTRDLTFGDLILFSSSPAPNINPTGRLSAKCTAQRSGRSTYISKRAD
jgi:hypothetical protein